MNREEFARYLKSKPLNKVGNIEILQKKYDVLKNNNNEKSFDLLKYIDDFMDKNEDLIFSWPLLSDKDIELLENEPLNAIGWHLMAVYKKGVNYKHFNKVIEFLCDQSKRRSDLRYPAIKVIFKHRDELLNDNSIPPYFQRIFQRSIDKNVSFNDNPNHFKFNNIYCSGEEEKILFSLSLKSDIRKEVVLDRLLKRHFSYPSSYQFIELATESEISDIIDSLNIIQATNFLDFFKPRIHHGGHDLLKKILDKINDLCSDQEIENHSFLTLINSAKLINNRFNKDQLSYLIEELDNYIQQNNDKNNNIFMAVKFNLMFIHEELKNENNLKPDDINIHHIIDYINHHDDMIAMRCAYLLNHLFMKNKSLSDSNFESYSDTKLYEIFSISTLLIQGGELDDIKNLEVFKGIWKSIHHNEKMMPVSDVLFD